MPNHETKVGARKEEHASWRLARIIVKGIYYYYHRIIFYLLSLLYPRAAHCEKVVGATNPQVGRVCLLYLSSIAIR